MAQTKTKVKRTLSTSTHTPTVEELNRFYNEHMLLIERRKKSCKKYYDSHRKKCIASTRKWQKTHSKHWNRYMRNWQKKRREKIKEAIEFAKQHKLAEPKTEPKTKA